LYLIITEKGNKYLTQNLKLTFMKKYRNSILIAAVVSSCWLTSCLKNTGYEDVLNGVNGNGVVSVFGSEAGFRTQTLEFSATPQDVEVTINLGSPQPFNNDVVVQMGVDPEALANYNKDQTEAAKVAGKTFEPFEQLPATAFTFPSPSVSIKAGQRDAKFIVRVNSSLVDLTKKFLLPLSITNASGVTVASNLKTSLIGIAVKNIYDGDYAAKGKVARQTASGVTNSEIDEDRTLTTVSGQRSRTIAGFFGNSTLLFDIIVNSNNTVTIEPVAEAAFAITGTTGKTSTYDPSTKTFKLFYGYTNSSGLTRVFEEELVRK
jgi:hypothetical protein